MQIEGSFTLKAPLEQVFDFLLKPETILACLPGAQSVQILDTGAYECVVKQKVGPVSVKLKFLSELTRVERPTRIEMNGRGLEMSKLGHLEQNAVVDLREVGPGEVGISYEAKIGLAGKLAMFGDRVLRAKAKEVEASFAKNLEERLRNEFS